jgi:hypothetical protein
MLKKLLIIAGVVIGVAVIGFIAISIYTVLFDQGGTA